MQVKAEKEKAPKKRSRRLVKILIGLFVLFVVAGVGMVGFTSSPSFCKSCHQMKPYFESWQASSHNQVSCIQCHFAPGIEPLITGKLNGAIQLIKTITNTQGPKPHAEVEDASCMRKGCHVREELPGELMFKGKYKFDHGPHLVALEEGGRLRCASCHSHFMEGEHMTVSPEACFICHFKGHMGVGELDPVAGCTACHEIPEKTITLADGATFEHESFIERGVECLKCHLDSVAGSGDVPKQACVQCHSEASKLEKYSDSEFLHNWHVTKRKVECLACHEEIRHGLRPEPQGEESCVRCHRTLFSPSSSMFAGVGAKGIEGSASMHFKASVECVACHELALHESMMSTVEMTGHGAGEEACAACHGSGIEGTLEAWREALDETLVDARKTLSAAKLVSSETQLDESTAAKVSSLLEAAEFNCMFVEKGRGVHNPDYAFEVLDKATSDAAEALRLLKSAKKLPPSADEG